MKNVKEFGIVFLLITALLGLTNVATWHYTSDAKDAEREAAVKEKDDYWRDKLAHAWIETTGTAPVTITPPPKQGGTVPGKPVIITREDSAKILLLTAKADSLLDVVFYLGQRWSWVYEDSLRTVFGMSDPSDRSTKVEVEDKPRTVQAPVLTRTVLQEDTIAPDRTKWYWSAGSLNIDFVWSGNLEAGASYSFWAWSGGGKDPKQIIARLPEIGLSSNFNRRGSVFMGARVNIGHWLPVVQDLYLSGKYGYDFYDKQWEPRVGIGTGI